MDHDGARGVGGTEGAEGRDQAVPEAVAFGTLGWPEGEATLGDGGLGRGADIDGRLTSMSLRSRYSRRADPEIDRLICRSPKEGAGRDGAALGAVGRGAESDGRVYPDELPKLDERDGAEMLGRE